MSVSYFPSRESMYKDIQLWIAANKLETLLSLCNFCTYKALDCTAAHQCRSCHVRRGINKLVHAETCERVEGDELLGVW